MNKLGDALNTILQEKSTAQAPLPTLRHTWTADYYNKILPGSHIHQKPNIILINKQSSAPQLGFTKSTREEITWHHVKSVGEVTSRLWFHQTLKNTINAKLYIMFLTQHDCNFVPMLSFFSNQCILTVNDCKSQQCSKVLQINRHREDLLTFIWILLALMFANNWVLGLDTTMTQNEAQEIEFIAVDGKDYCVVKFSIMSSHFWVGQQRSGMSKGTGSIWF
jgi:hypothetical protein